MSKNWSRKIGDIVDAIRDAEGECVFLIGAGCSKSAGIPLAGELIEKIKIDFPNAYSRAVEKDNYNSVMSELTAGQRTKLLNGYIENAKINWGHLALAQLFHTKQIDRILTVNFDPLIVRACAMVGHFPAIYDLATAHKFKESRIAPRSVFYLNGQHTGFTTLNAEGELEQHRERLRQIASNTGSKRTWVVVGYSGAADPLLDVLAETLDFDGGLYWVGFDGVPSSTLCEKLLDCHGKEAFYLGGQDADKFLTELAQLLGCFPPEILARPFDHVINMVEHINFETGSEPGKLLKDQLAEQISQAQRQRINQLNDVDLMNLLLAGKYREIFSLYKEIKNPSDIQKEIAAAAYVNFGFTLDVAAGEIAETDPDEAARKWRLAESYFRQALDIKSDTATALITWGSALSHEAKFLGVTDLIAACNKWKLAGEKFQQAIVVEEKSYVAFCSWAAALNYEAIALAPTNIALARDTWRLANEKFQQAHAIKPDMPTVLNSWGCILLEQLHFEAEGEQKILLDNAQDLFQKAEQLQHGSAAYNQACVAAHKGDISGCISWLKQSQAVGLLPSLKHISADHDFDEIRTDPDFIEWLSLAYP